MHIVLLVLKIIGYILLGLLALVILLFFWLTCSKISYSGSLCGHYDQEENNYSGYLKIHYLQHLVRFYAVLGPEITSKLYILFFRIGKNEKKDESVYKEQTSSTKSDETYSNQHREHMQKAESETKQYTNTSNTTTETSGTDESAKKEVHESASNPNPVSSGTEKEKHSSKHTFKNAPTTKIEKIKEIYDEINLLLEDERLTKYRQLLWRQFRYLLNRMLPRKIQGNFKFSFEDPAITGYCMAFYSAFLIKHEKNLSFFPDFDEEATCLDGDISLKGRIRLIWFIKVLLRLLISPNTYYTLNKYKEERAKYERQ